MDERNGGAGPVVERPHRPGRLGAGRHGLGRRELVAAAGAGVVGVGAVVAGGLVLRHARHSPAVAGRTPLEGTFRRLVLSWPATNPMLFAVARANFFASYHLDVSLAGGVPNGRAAIAALAAGRAVGAVSPILTWLDVYQQGGLQGGQHGGVPAHLVAGLQSGTFRLLVRRKVKITRLDNVAGLRIAVTDPDMADRLFFSVMMRRKGIDPDRAVQWLTLPPEQVEAAARAGEIDAVAAHDPLAWRLLHAADSPFFELANSVNGNYGARANLALSLSDTFLQADPAAAAALVMALRAASDWIRDHPAQAASLMAGQGDGTGQADILAMLRHERLGVSPVGADLRVQVAQYVDEMKLLGRVPDTVGSAAYARRVCFNALQADATRSFWPLGAGPR